MHSILERRPLVPLGIASVTVREEGLLLKKASGLHLTRPHWWTPTQRPETKPGRVFAASVRNVPRREGVPPHLRTAGLLGGALGGQWTSPRIRFPRHTVGIVVPWYLGSEVLGCCTLRLESQSSAGLGMQVYPRSPVPVWPGDLRGTGCLSARAMDTRFSSVVWHVCLGLGFAFTPAFVDRDCACGWVHVLAGTLQILVGSVAFVLGYGFCPTTPFLAWVFGVCVWVRALL